MKATTPNPRRRASRTAAQPTPQTINIPKGKLGTIVTLMARPQGATLAEMMTASGWQAHSVRGVIAGAIKKKLGLIVTSERPDKERIYRVAAANA